MVDSTLKRLNVNLREYKIRDYKDVVCLTITEVVLVVMNTYEKQRHLERLVTDNSD